MKRIILAFSLLSGLLIAMVAYIHLGSDTDMPYEAVAEQAKAFGALEMVQMAPQPAAQEAEPAPELGKTLRDPFRVPPPLINSAQLRLEGQETFTLEIAGNYSASSFGGTCIELLKVTLENWSEGKIKVIHYSDSLLGSDKEIFQIVRQGSAAMGFMTSAPQYAHIPEVAVFDMGGYPVNYAAAVSVMREGPFREAINAAYAKVGLELIALFPTSFRELGSTHPVRSFEDLHGLRIRVMENPNHAEFWRCMGAEPVQMPMLDTYISLQQGLLNASENPLDTMLTNRITEQSKFYTETHHILFNNTIIGNSAKWAALPDDYRAMVAHAASRVSDWATANGPLRTSLAIQKLKALGCEIIPFPEEDRERMRKAAEPLYAKIRKTVGDELVDLWLTELAKHTVNEE
jgi:TRAP-type C4-dicarboxylate transport system, periplasmic component